jgi:hypothetical protein
MHFVLALAFSEGLAAVMCVDSDQGISWKNSVDVRMSCFTYYSNLNQPLVTGIPIETSHQDTRPASTSRPPWIRPVRKKATPGVKLNSCNSPSNSSQHDGALEAFSPSDFLVDTPKSVHASGPASPASSTNQPQFSMAESIGSTFDNTSGITCEVRHESQMDVPPEMFELFKAGGMDMTAWFSPIMQAQVSR